jgi:Na+-transporting NADH:ubiquinone oxidoreductase subunit NqrC
VLDNPSFYDKFIGIVKNTLGGVENSAGATLTSNGYKEAINNAFAAFEIIKAEGGIR